MAPVRGNGPQVLYRILFIAGAVLLPLGLVVIGLGWYGVAHTPYVYDQLAYLVSGGLLGIGITVCGGFLYFGSWLARIAADQKEASQRLSDTLLALGDVLPQGRADDRRPRTPRPGPGEALVVAGGGRTVHRADCELVAGRNDLTPAGPDAGLVACRMCRPGGGAH